MSDSSTSHRIPARGFSRRAPLAAALVWFALCAPVLAAGKLVVGGDAAYPPYEFVDESGQIAGCNVDLTRAVAETMGLDVEIRLRPWAETREGLLSGEIDAVQGMFRSEEREAHFDFSAPHTVVYHAAFQRKDAPPLRTPEGLRGRTVAVMHGDIMHDWLLESGFGIEPVLTATQGEALDLVEQGAVDCALAARLPGLYWIEKKGLERVVAADLALRPEPYCYAVLEGNHETLAAFAEGLAILKRTGEYQRIHAEWLGVLEQPGFTTREALTLAAWIALPLAALLALALLWLWSLRRLVARRTRDLERERNLLEGIFAGTPDWLIFQDIEGRFLAVNEAFCRFIGRSRKELLGRSSDEVLPEDETRCNREERRAALEAGETIETDRRFIRDGERRWMNVARTPILGEDGKPCGVLTSAREVTERYRAEERIRETETRFSLIADNIPEVFWLTASGDCGRVVYVSPAWERIAGRPPEALYRRPQLWIDLIHPADRERVAATRLRLLREGGVGEERYRIVREDGRVLWIEERIGAIADRQGSIVRLAGLSRDVTARVQADEELRRHRLLLNETGRIARIGGWEYAPERDFTTWTDAMYALCEVDPESFEPTLEKMLAFCAPENRESLAALLARAAESGEAFDTEVRLVTAKGRSLWAHVVGHVEGEKGRTERLIGTVQDVTDRREAERERSDLEAQLQHAQKLESLGVLAGGIAHDFNNILMTILGNADLALQELSALSPARCWIEDIETAGRRAADLCRQMLAYSGKGRFELKPVNLSDLIFEMTHMLELSISKSAVLQYSFEENLPCVEGDPSQLRQVVMNLIINASEAVGGKNGLISATTGSMFCDAEYLAAAFHDENLQPGRYVYMEVADDGCGMDRETIARVFEPFFTTKFTGRGLGLAAVLGIVRGHGGGMQITSEPGRGTTFKMLLPACDRTAEPHIPDAAPVLDEQGSPDGSVLIVDDEASVCAVGARLIERMGLRAETACDGVEALETFERNPEAYCCVLLDLTMPRMGGEETFRRLRRIRPDLPVVMTSGYNEQDVTQRFAGKGVTGFLQKPYRSVDLQRKIHEVLGRREPEELSGTPFS